MGISSTSQQSKYWRNQPKLSKYISRKMVPSRASCGTALLVLATEPANYIVHVVVLPGGTQLVPKNKRRGRTVPPVCWYYAESLSILGRGGISIICKQQTLIHISVGAVHQCCNFFIFKLCVATGHDPEQMLFIYFKFIKCLYCNPFYFCSSRKHRGQSICEFLLKLNKTFLEFM